MVRPPDIIVLYSQSENIYDAISSALSFPSYLHFISEPRGADFVSNETMTATDHEWNGPRMDGDADYANSSVNTITAAMNGK